MENDRFSFRLEEADITCEVVRDLNHYSVYIQDLFQGILERDDMPKWVQVTGEPMPQPIIEEIGQKIELHGW
jgi:predicted regulator of amino acid metabolism with ACT domain